MWDRVFKIFIKIRSRIGLIFKIFGEKRFFFKKKRKTEKIPFFIFLQKIVQNPIPYRHTFFFRKNPIPCRTKLEMHWQLLLIKTGKIFVKKNGPIRDRILNIFILIFLKIRSRIDTFFFSFFFIFFKKMKKK